MKRPARTGRRGIETRCEIPELPGAGVEERVAKIAVPCTCGVHTWNLAVTGGE
jgi:hypothetical protein